MPSSRTHSRSVTSCRPLAARSKSAIAQIDHANVPRAPRMARARAATPGSSSPENAAAAGSHRGMERGRLTSSLGLQEEVEDHGAGADQQQRRVGAQEAGLQGADRGRPGPDDARRSAHERPVDEDPLEGLLAEAPEPGERLDDQPADQLVEVPLVDEEAVQSRYPLADTRG